MLSFISIRTKVTIGAGLGLVLLGGLGGYKLGKRNAPEKIVTVDKVVEKQVVVTKTEIQTVYVKDTSQKVHRIIVETKTPDGAVTKTTHEDTDISTETKKNEKADSENFAYKEIVKEKIVTVTAPIKKWTIGAMVTEDLLHVAPLGLDLNKPLVTGYLNRTLWGPTYVGVWGNSEKQAGITLGVVGRF